jgi:hypothetical protein
MTLLFWYLPYMIMSGVFDTFYQSAEMRTNRKYAHK